MTVDEAVAAAAKRANEQLTWHKAAAAKWADERRKPDTPPAPNPRKQGAEG